MKHCPNPDCTGLKKFGFISEFNDTATACGDCGGELVAGSAPSEQSADQQDPDPDMVLVPVLMATEEADLVIIESLLTEAGIPYLGRGEQIQDLFGWGRLVGVNPITGPVQFLVAADDADDAREVLADFLIT